MPADDDDAGSERGKTPVSQRSSVRSTGSNGTKGGVTSPPLKASNDDYNGDQKENQQPAAPKESPEPPAEDHEGHEGGVSGDEYEEEDQLSRIAEETEQLRAELDDIEAVMPEVVYESLPESFDIDGFPESYKSNTCKETVVLSFAENFRRQYTHLYRDRKPLFLTPKNECDLEKLVCTYVRPTKLPYTEVYDWDGASEFVADYLNFVPLDIPTEVPKRLLSPITTLKYQKGTCFEYATVLACLLLGNGYDAYVVSGYATKEACFMDESRKECPLLLKKKETQEVAKKSEYKKYAVKPPRDLKSRYEIHMEAKRREAERKETERLEKEAEQREAELDKPPPDQLFGLRVHAWILVLSGKREIPESFFIEPLTGTAHPVTSDLFLGIESLWNHQNYWVNMQDCSEGVKHISYDLGDSTLWEYMFPSNEKPLLTIPQVNMQEEDLDQDGEEKNDQDVERHLDLPPSWVEDIVVEEKDFASRCPQGKKVKLYKKAKLEKFAPYLLRESLITRLTIYEDRDLKKPLEIREFFFKRNDKLHQRVTNCLTDWITDYFLPGRYGYLKEHSYHRYSSGFPKERSMLFYNHSRVDGLAKRQESPVEMVEHYLGRPDFLCYRRTKFQSDLSLGPRSGTGASNRPIESIVERYLRNPAKPAHEDVQERSFLIREDRIILVYHVDQKNVAACTREFIKPPRNEDKGQAIRLLPDTHSSFQVDPNVKNKKNVEVYQMLLWLMEEEDKAKDSVRWSENETRSILESRTTEEVNAQADISNFDTLRNIKAKEYRKELERNLIEEKYRRTESELDYLAPFLAQNGLTEPTNKAEAYKVREECLQDFKQRLVDKANLIQARFEKETLNLRKKQQWYQQNQINMTQDDENEYLQFCREANFRIATLELMLNRHKQAAPVKYLELEQKLRNDPRVGKFLDD